MNRIKKMVGGLALIAMVSGSGLFAQEEYYVGDNYGDAYYEGSNSTNLGPQLAIGVIFIGGLVAALLHHNHNGNSHSH